MKYKKLDPHFSNYFIYNIQSRKSKSVGPGAWECKVNREAEQSLMGLIITFYLLVPKHI